MDGTRFDTMTRSLAVSRRSTFKALVGGAVGGLVANHAAEEAAAGCKKVGKKCDKNKDCCDGATCKGGQNGKCRCKNGREDCDGNGKCEQLDNDNANCGVCGVACAPGETCCNSVCLDTQSDRANCGGCGIACGGSEACAAGVCITCLPSAPLCGDRCCASNSCCGGICVDLETSRVNCGSCFNVCEFDEECIGGACKDGSPSQAATLSSDSILDH